jgi:hypothetical protein
MEYYSQCNYTITVLAKLKKNDKTVPMVPDRRSQILEVVTVRRLVTWVLGIWRGEGMGKG